MSQDFVLHLAEQTVYITILIMGPIIGIALIVGLIVSILQATTQIQEQTLTFVPKIIVMMIFLVIFGPWMLTKLLDFTVFIFSNLNQFSK